MALQKSKEINLECGTVTGLLIGVLQRVGRKDGVEWGLLYINRDLRDVSIRCNVGTLYVSRFEQIKSEKTSSRQVG